ncbi:16S rRNA (cytosine(967)-C(5))-methyltransferase RsmB [Shouchella patagoniensis]|uniref:16S rRNA (cytosine(967)-C(5))-methyltransferase RsmB n=1 Tax=Shouchella patagoniensis TaxID=228576 RepID=UPI000994AB39|nr:16S rRNA (cytosine(967)-C(5))-methyltransferase RsmB [Shouchella patagoniensis]
MNKPSVREVALDALIKVEKNQAFSHLLLNTTLNKAGLDKRDGGLLTELVYGTIAHRLTLDYYLSPFLVKSKKRDLWVDVLLRLSVYQMVYLDRIPDRAIVHEAVTIAKTRGHKGISGMVNGVLRSIQREGLPDLHDIQEPLTRHSITTSHPEWLLDRWVKQYGEEAAVAMAQANNEHPEVTLRVNHTLATSQEVIQALDKEGVKAEESLLLKELALVVKKGNAFSTNAFKQGLFTAQDEASMMVGLLVHASKDMCVLDTCAAPGGKSTHIAESMDNTGTVRSLDLHKHKVKLIAEQAERLQLSQIHTDVEDARNLNELTERTFDRVLVDAPCTGFGVIRRKPDIRWAKTEKDVNAISNVQAAILANASRFVKKEGTLVYSTCTVEKEENEQVVEQFLLNHPSFKVDESAFQVLPDKIQKEGRFNNFGLTMLPQDFGTDGFFMVALKRV